MSCRMAAFKALLNEMSTAVIHLVPSWLSKWVGNASSHPCHGLNSHSYSLSRSSRRFTLLNGPIEQAWSD